MQAWRGSDEACEATFRRAVAHLEPVAPVDLARAWARRAAWNCGALCRPRRVRDSARRAIEILDAAALPSAELRVEALDAWAWGEAVAGEPSTADALLARVTRGARGRAGRRPGPHWMAHVRALSLVRRGRFEESYGARSPRARPPSGPVAGPGPQLLAERRLHRRLRRRHGQGTGVRGQRGRRTPGHRPGDPGGPAPRRQGHVLTRMSRLEEARVRVRGRTVLADRLENPALRAPSEHDRAWSPWRSGIAQAANVSWPPR